MGELRNRYLNRDGGYTRVMLTEPKNTYDQAESAVLEFVDGPKDSRFMMTAKTVARDRLLGRQPTPITSHNVAKVTRYRGQQDFQDMVRRFMLLATSSDPDAETPSLASEAARAAEQETAAAQRITSQLKPETRLDDKADATNQPTR